MSESLHGVCWELYCNEWESMRQLTGSATDGELWVHHCECVLSLSYRRSRRRKELAQHNHTLLFVFVRIFFIITECVLKIIYLDWFNCLILVHDNVETLIADGSEYTECVYNKQYLTVRQHSWALIVSRGRKIREWVCWLVNDYMQLLIRDGFCCKGLNRFRTANIR